MSKKDFENFFASLWNTFPHPCFVIDKKLEIIDINVSSETICMTSKHRMVGKKIDDFVEKGSLLLKVIDQTHFKQSPIVIYDIDIFWGKKEIGKFNVHSSPLEGKQMRNTAIISKKLLKLLNIICNINIVFFFWTRKIYFLN